MFARGSGADQIADFTPGTDRRHSRGSPLPKLLPETVAGTAGLLVTYGQGGDSVFLANIVTLAAGDSVFG